MKNPEEADIGHRVRLFKKNRKKTNTLFTYKTTFL